MLYSTLFASHYLPFPACLIHLDFLHHLLSGSGLGQWAMQSKPRIFTLWFAIGTYWRLTETRSLDSRWLVLGLSPNYDHRPECQPDEFRTWFQCLHGAVNPRHNFICVSLRRCPLFISLILSTCQSEVQPKIGSSVEAHAPLPTSLSWHAPAWST